MPTCDIYTSDTSPALLLRIDKALPGLKISSIEYTMDILCKNPQAVSDLFYMLRRYTYIPRSKNTFMAGGKFYGWRENRNTNAVYVVPFSGSKLVKIYERGDDSKAGRNDKGKPFWYHDDVDRVRFEFTLRRRGKQIKKLGIGDLCDFIDHPRFETFIFSDSPKYHEIQFKNFTKHRKLRQDYEDFNAQDVEGNIEAFQVEYLQAKKRGFSNLSHYMEDKDKLESLKKTIRISLRKFDQNWRDEVDVLK